MKIEVKWNQIDNSWWLDLGISWCIDRNETFNEYSTNRGLDYKNVVTISFIVFSVYMRF